MGKILLFLCIVGVLWFWRDSLRARETVLARCRDYCGRYQYQLLDATVAIHRVRPRRTASGSLALQRQYQFEYSIAGVERRRGHATIFNGKITDIYLEQEDGTRLLEGMPPEDDRT